MIDAHVHFWDPARGDDILILRRVPSLSQRVTPSDLLPLMRAAGVTRAVAIQSAPDPSETSHLIATCKPIPEIAAVVGWVDLSAPDVAMNIKTLMRQPKIVGVRAMLNRIDRNDWLVSANVLAGLAALSDAGATLDLIARAEHIPAILSIAARLPASPSSSIMALRLRSDARISGRGSTASLVLDPSLQSSQNSLGWLRRLP